MAGSALLWNNGAYMFGNADEDSFANKNGQGNAILDAEAERQANLQSNKDADVTVAGENELGQKKRTQRPPYDANKHLLGENGLDFIYKHFASFISRGKGHEKSDLRKLIEKYKEWAFIMYPAMRFEDIVTKTKKFSSSNAIKNHMQKLRDQRDGKHVMSMSMDEAEEENNDIDMKQNEKQNESSAQRQLERKADDENKQQINENEKEIDFEKVVADRANRENNAPAVNKDMNIQQPRYDDFWGPDPMADMMNFDEPGQDEADLAAMMYG